ncbi:CRISPR-associated protein, partial [bacterium]|nr:CRISPR-associated protein [bacterium]
MSLKNKIDFAVVFKVKNANPNGDPLNGNRPRTSYNRIGEVSDVCIKRKIRNRLMEVREDKKYKYDIFVQSDDNKLDDCKNLRERAETGLDLNKSSKENATLACEKWFDVRAFGQVFAYAGEKKGSGVSIGVRGPVSIHTAFSLSPVDITSTQITKSVSGEGDGT